MRSLPFGAVCAGVLTVFSTLSHAVILPLESRLGGLAYYDPNLDITWATGANINGLMTWNEANTWAATLDVGGVSGWRLPGMDRNKDGTVVNCAVDTITSCLDNEPGYLFYGEGISQASPDPFSNIGFSSYWSTTDSTNIPDGVWLFDFSIGGVGEASKNGLGLAWAVQSGDVSAVPAPAAVWLFGSGLLGLAGMARRKKAE